MLCELCGVHFYFYIPDFEKFLGCVSRVRDTTGKVIMPVKGTCELPLLLAFLVRGPSANLQPRQTDIEGPADGHRLSFVGTDHFE